MSNSIMGLFNKVVLGFCSALLAATVVIYPISSAHAKGENQDQKPVKQMASDIEKEATDLENEAIPFLSLIEKMPEEVANSGVNSGVKWMNANKGSEFDGFQFIQVGDSLKLVPIQSKITQDLNWIACTWAVGQAIAGNLIPWAKILKVKKAAQAVGGIQKMTKMVTTAYTHQRNLGYGKMEALKRGITVAAKAFPKDARQAVLDFFSLGALGACFADASNLSRESHIA